MSQSTLTSHLEDTADVTSFKQQTKIPKEPPDPNLLAHARPHIDHLITEDDEPVDNRYSEKQQRLLTRPLYNSDPNLKISPPFLAMANVGLFYKLKQPPIMPDMLLSLNAKASGDRFAKHNLSYMLWEIGKPPEVVIELVSNKIGGEYESKKQTYAQIDIPYYVIFNPMELMDQPVLQSYMLDPKTSTYQTMAKAWFPDVGLGLKLWTGIFETDYGVWLRWHDEQGHVILTGQELAEKERQRAEKYVAKLKELGITIEPEE